MRIIKQSTHLSNLISAKTWSHGFANQEEHLEFGDTAAKRGSHERRVKEKPFCGRTRKRPGILFSRAIPAGQGFGQRNVEGMRKFYLAFAGSWVSARLVSGGPVPIPQTLSAESESAVD